MTRRIAAILFIFACTTVAWLVLASTINDRTFSSDNGLRKKVASSWGSAQVQSSPIASYVEALQEHEDPGDDKSRIVKTYRTINVPLDASRINVGIDLDQRQKGLLWYSTYIVNFEGDFAFRNPTGQPREISFSLPVPAEQGLYDDVQVAINGQPVTISDNASAFSTSATIPAGQAVNVHFGYRSHGMDSWRYDFGGKAAHVRDFALNMHTNFKGIDFPDSTLSPTTKRETPAGWDLSWNYKNLVSGFGIGMTAPEHVQPGPLAGQISYFAPVSLLFFFFVMFTITTLRGIDLHPMNYFFLAAAFFAFHLLLAYLADHVDIHAAFVICSLVSVFLVVSYLRLAVGMRFAAVEAGISQFVYLVLFSYAFFYQGYTGLTITIGAIISLFVAMQMTGRINWSEKFKQPMIVGPMARPTAWFRFVTHAHCRVGVGSCQASRPRAPAAVCSKSSATLAIPRGQSRVTSQPTK